jgi:pyocin large subunit-like protein
MSKRHNNTGRSTGEGRFIGIPHEVLNSPGYKSTAAASRAVLVELVMVYNGGNNGRIARSVRQLAERCNISRDTAANAIQDLEDAGLIETVQKGSFKQRNRRASEFRLLWKRCDVSGALPQPKYRDER